MNDTDQARIEDWSEDGPDESDVLADNEVLAGENARLNAAIERMSAVIDLPLEVRALILKAAIAVAEKELDELTKGLKVSYPLPATIPFESPLDGAKLGYVQRARTTPEWKVTSTAQLLDHFVSDYPDVLETVFLIDTPIGEIALPEDHPITAALAGAAPELLTPQQRVPAEVVEDALEQSRNTGEPAAPGIQLVRAAQGNLNVVYDKKEGIPAITRMVRAGLIDWSGRPVEAAEQRAVAS